MIEFDLPKGKSSIIKVIGMGGGGSNAVNYMYEQGIEGVDFIICNTDSQALAESPIPNKVHLGPNLTQGLGAGANPEIGRQATEESMEELRKILEVNTKMVFITAGMGGGTGTGGGPIVAKICKDLGILTVGIVTSPFSYEGKRRMKQAEEGIKNLKDHVDTLLVISNDKLRMQCGNLPFKAAFAKADNILATAAKCITDVINLHGVVNVDFADVCTAMKNGGVAILGSATADGEDRAQEAIDNALSSPLLNDSEIKGAKWILLNITSSDGEHEHTIDEMDTIQAFVQQQAGEDCDVILGMGHDNDLGEELGVTIIATGFKQKPIEQVLDEPKRALREKHRKITMQLGKDGEEKKLYEKKKRQEKQADSDPMAPRLTKKENYSDASNETSFADDKESQASKKEYYELDSSQNSTPEMDAPKKNNPSSEKDQAHSIKTQSEDVDSGDVEEEKESDIKMFFKREEKKLNQERKKFFSRRRSKNEKRPEDNPYIGHTVYPTPDYLEDREKDTDKEKLQENRERKREEYSDGSKSKYSHPSNSGVSDKTAQIRQVNLDMNDMGNADEIEYVPAYIRRKIKLNEEQKPSEQNDYSKYRINKKEGNKDQSEISTINTFLDGKKPD